MVNCQELNVADAVYISRKVTMSDKTNSNYHCKSYAEKLNRSCNINNSLTS